MALNQRTDWKPLTDDTLDYIASTVYKRKTQFSHPFNLCNKNNMRYLSYSIINMHLLCSAHRHSVLLNHWDTFFFRFSCCSCYNDLNNNQYKIHGKCVMLIKGVEINEGNVKLTAESIVSFFFVCVCVTYSLLFLLKSNYR